MTVRTHYPGRASRFAGGRPRALDTDGYADLVSGAPLEAAGSLD